MATKQFEDLAVWRKAHQAVLMVYRISSNLPVAERFVLVPQIRRAAISIPANIAEGFSRIWPKDMVRFYAIARTSAMEVRYYCRLLEDLGYGCDARSLVPLLEEVSKMVYALIRRIMGEDL